MINDFKYQDKLQSERSRTRFLNAGDVETWAEFFKQEEAVKLFPSVFVAHGENNSKVWVNRQIERYNTGLYGLQAITTKTTNVFAGQCGLLKQEVDGMVETEVGYHFFKQHWGQGYAPEAAKLFIDFAFSNGVKSVVSIIDVRNTNSQRVAEKNGLTIDKKTTWGGLDVFIYRILNPLSV